MAKATYDASGVLMDGGIDLNMESGMAEWVWVLSPLFPILPYTFEVVLYFPDFV